MLCSGANRLQVTPNDMCELKLTEDCGWAARPHGDADNDNHQPPNPVGGDTMLESRRNTRTVHTRFSQRAIEIARQLSRLDLWSLSSSS